jgi:hypothetical protein
MILRRCRPASIAGLAADLALPLGAVRVLLAGMPERGLVATGVKSMQHRMGGSG